MNIKDEIFEAYGEMKAEQDLLAVGYTALLGTSMAAKKRRGGAFEPIFCTVCERMPESL